MALSINDIKGGLTIDLDGQVYLVLECQHVKPGKGAAFVRVKVRQIKTGAVQEYTFRGNESIAEAFVEERKLQYQYSSGDMLHFMDTENYEELGLPSEAIGDKAKFLKDNLEVSAYFYKNDLINVALPNFIVFAVTHTEPGIKGDTAKSGTKPATLESGAVVQVPLFVVEGDTIKVDTRSGAYVERAAR